MIVGRFKGSTPVLMAEAGEAGGGGGDTTVIDDEDTVTGAEGTDTLEGGDRGDDLNPPIDKTTLQKVAGEGGDDTAAGAEGTDAGGKKGSSHVPIGRFNEVNEEKKRLEREVAELKKTAPQPTPTPTPPPKAVFDEDKAERDYATLLAEGEFDKAVALRKQINANIREQAREQAETNVEARIDQRSTVQSLTDVAKQAVKDWPYLDTEEGAETMDLIIAARDGMHAKGVSLPEALRQAVAKIAPKFAPEGQGTPGKDLSAGGAGADTRTQQANARGAEASTRQPPRTEGGAGNRTQAAKVDVEQMTEAQFDALSPQEKARLRGDDS